MYASFFFALAAATLASAAPVNQARSEDCGAFAITNFVFGCTSGCYYNFDVAIQGSFENHPAVDTPVHCEGGWSLDASDRPSDYVLCDTISETQSVGAFINRDTNVLSLQYTANNYNTGGVYRYMGNETVYAATSDNADLQKPDFVVPETSATGVL